MFHKSAPPRALRALARDVASGQNGVVLRTIQQRRPRMANLSPSLLQVKAQLHRLVSDKQIHQICDGLHHRWRDRVLNPALTVQLFLLQLLSKVALEGLRHVSAVSVSAQAICKAKMRLPLQLFIELVSRSVPGKPGESRWHGFVVYLADGMSFLIPDKPALAKRF